MSRIHITITLSEHDNNIDQLPIRVRLRPASHMHDLDSGQWAVRLSLVAAWHCQADIVLVVVMFELLWHCLYGHGEQLTHSAKAIVVSILNSKSTHRVADVYYVNMSGSKLQRAHKDTLRILLEKK